MSLFGGDCWLNKGGEGWARANDGHLDTGFSMISYAEPESSIISVI